MPTAPTASPAPVTHRVAFGLLALLTSSGIVTSLVLGWTTAGHGFLAGLLLTPLSQLQFFTFMSNTLVLITSAQLALSRDWSRTWHVLRISGIICISITGVVFNLLLSEGGLVGLSVFNNAVVHIAVPILAPLLWLALGPRTTTWRRLLQAMAIPIAWLAVTLVRGAIDGWYPYTILDVTSIGYGGVSGYVAGILVFYFALGALMCSVDHVVRKRSGASLPEPYSPGPDSVRGYRA